jgi:hypothetical protein
MKTVIGIRTKLVFLLIIFVIIVFVVYLNTKKENENFNINTDGLATINNPVISPSGKYQMKIAEEKNSEVKAVKFAIYKISNGKVESTPTYSSKESFRTRDTVLFLWGEEDQVWVYSGDVGTFFWTCVSENNWVKYSYGKNKEVAVPELLKKLKPKYYKN